MMDETIAALSTAPYAAGIHVIRMSGSRAAEILKEIFLPVAKTAQFEHGKMYYGHVTENGVFLDEVYAVSFYAPKSYTGEDVVEIQCHGSAALSGEILRLLMDHGAVPAEPGEFTKRAFLNGRLDLIQAEAVMDVIGSTARDASKNALEQLEGRLSRDIGELKELLVDVLANIDVDIDFPEADVEAVDRKGLAQRLAAALKKIREMLDTVERGRVLKEGARLVICGAPNAGKSSLMNCLLGQERTIVTDIPGTTRDVIEEAVTVNGIRLRLFDTAGVHDTRDVVESMGIERTKAALQNADLVLMLIDGAQKTLSEEDRRLLAMTGESNRIVAVNKTDLLPEERLLKETEALAGAFLLISAKSGEGTEALRQQIYDQVMGKSTGEGVFLTNARQVHCLRESAAALEQAMEEMEDGVPLDIAGISVREGYGRLLELLGEEISDEVVDRIFLSFCLGK